MPSNSLPAPVLQQLVAVLGGLTREIAAGQTPADDDLAVLLLGVGLEEDSAALAELQRWTKLLCGLYGKPGSRRVTLEALVLRGVPEASALLAVETVCTAAAPPAGAPAAPVPLHIEPNELDFGTCRDGQPQSAELQVRGGPGTICVESSWVKVEPQAFGPGQTTVRVTVTPPAEGLLLTPLTLSTTAAKQQVMVSVLRSAAADPAAAVPSPAASHSVVVAPQDQPAAAARPAVVGSVPTTAPLHDQPAAAARPAAAAPPAMEQTIYATGDAAASGARLAAAIHSASAGATIRIGAGEFVLPGSLEVRKSIRLIGAGMQQTRVIGKQGEAVLKLIGAGPFTLHDMAFSYAGSAAADVVVVHDGAIEVLRCRFSDAVKAGSQCGNGLSLRGTTSGVVRACVSNNNRADGIFVSDGARPELIENRCEQNGGAGIHYSGTAGGTARGNICRENKITGITVASAQPLLEQNTCLLNRESGIMYDCGSRGTSRGNTCGNNAQHGISVRHGAQPTLERNICERNERAGIFFDFSTGGMACGNTCRENTVGIQINTDNKVKLENNKCSKNADKNIVDLSKWWSI